MANLTLKVDDQVLLHARIRALEEGTSVNELVRKYLETFAVSREEPIRAMRGILRIAAVSQSGSGGRKWKREDLYDRPGLRRY